MFKNFKTLFSNVVVPFCNDVLRHASELKMELFGFFFKPYVSHQLHSYIFTFSKQSFNGA